MPFNKWFIYTAAYVIGQIIGWVGEAIDTFILAEDINNGVGFQVDKVASGAGFLGYLRPVIEFFTYVLPRLIAFNFSFFQGNLQLFQWGIVAIFGVTFLAMTVGQRVLGGR